jgi:hypothetical protein
MDKFNNPSDSEYQTVGVLQLPNKSSETASLCKMSMLSPTLGNVLMLCSSPNIHVLHDGNASSILHT